MEALGGSEAKLAQLPDLNTCADLFFRPVALTNGPDGCIYIVDWYNKIISHNEVPRAHPDRDKTRGRIWRVKVKNAAAKVPDLAALSSAEVFQPGREITFTGTIEGYENRKVGEYDYRYPRLAAEVVYLWPVRKDVDVVVERYPYWWW